MNIRLISESLQLKASTELNEDPLKIDEDVQHIREWLIKQPHLAGRLEKHTVFYHITTKMPFRILNNDLQTKACIDLGENPERISDDLKQIQEWAEKQSHLNIRTDDQWLISFLRGCKFSLQRTKEKLDLLYSVKTAIPEFFHNRDPYLPEIQELLKQGICLPLPNNDILQPRVILFRVKPVDALKQRVEDCAKLTFMILDILVNEDDNFVIAGCKVLVDESGVSTNHMLQITPNIANKLVTCFLNAYALRTHGIHVINAPSFAVKAFEMFKPFLTNKLVDKMHFHNENDVLLDCIPKSILPAEYGGEGQTIPELIDSWKLKVESYSKWYEEDSKYGSNEALRIETDSSLSKMYGIDGSFRKLDID